MVLIFILNGVTLKTSNCPQNLKFGDFTLLFCKGRRENTLKYIPHMQHDCVYSLNLLFVFFAVAKLPFPLLSSLLSSLLKPHNL